MQKIQRIRREHFKWLDDFPHWKVVVAGGINKKTISDIVLWKPEILIVGGAITGADNP
ncbi:hypothetical protein ACE1TI_06840 [Alteribacillus sp. JSM 102045]|uniref:hypothetical protein n=1 Tax=Alteribacillus sp. JSM 102045 TaxID=1562101 RepID=UPI0035C06057